MLTDWDIAGLQMSQAVDVLLALQSDPVIWRWMDNNVSPEVIAAYWKRVPAHCYLVTQDDLQYAVERFISHGRPLAACKLLQLKHEKIELDGEFIASCLETGLSSDTEPLPQDVDAYCIQTLIGLLQSTRFDVERLAWIEWGYIRILTAHYSRTSPSTLELEARRSPAFFRALVAASFARPKDAGDDPDASKAMEIRRQQARKLLHSLREVPGESDGDINETGLGEWIDGLRSDADRDDEWEQIGMTLGSWLGRRCLDGETGRLIEVEEVFRALENLCCDATIDGFAEVICNGRGVTSRNPFEGGSQERELEAYFERLAENHSTAFPLVAQCFRQLAKHYRAYAKREDEEAAQIRLHRR